MMKIKKIRNLTGRGIDLLVGDKIIGLGTELGNLPNVHYRNVDDPDHEIIVGNTRLPVAKQEFTEITDLPEPEDGVILIVKPIVARAAADRPDVFTVSDPVAVAKRKRQKYRTLLHY